MWPFVSPGSTRREGLERKRAESLSFIYKSWVGLSASLLDNPGDVVHVVQLHPSRFLAFHPKQYHVLGGATTSINSCGVPELSLLAQPFKQVSGTSLAAARS